MNASLEKYKNALETKLALLLSASEQTKEDRKPVELDQSKVGRLSRMDAMQVQAMADALDGRRKNEITRIQSALKRMEDGEFGFCVACGEEISANRLDLDPSVVKCADC